MMAEISERKRSQLQALERRFGTSPLSSKSPLLSTSSPSGMMGETPISERKRSHLQALERRLATTPSSKIPLLSIGPSSSSTYGNDPSYARLCGSKATRKEEDMIIDGILRELVGNSEKSVKDLSSVLDMRIQDRTLLLDNPVGHNKAIERARFGKRSRKHLSMCQHKKMGSLFLSPTHQRYNLFLPMHEMWQDYAKNLIKSNIKIAEQDLLQTELHGAILAVVQAKNTTYVGVQGIMIRETDNTFGILTSLDKFWVVPKAGSVFVFHLGDMRITLFGNKLSVRNMNSGKK